MTKLRTMAPQRAKSQENLDLATNVTDKEERKRQRRLRVERAIAAQDKDGMETANDDGDKEECSLSQQQVADSLAHLDKKKGAGIDVVTAIRVAADDRETQRRMADETARQERLQRLQEEAVRSGRQNAAVEMRWAELLDENMPQELHRNIEEQKVACAEIIASKDALVNNFQLQLKAKDEEYVKALKRQADDIDDLLERMRSELKELQEEYEVELDAVEDVFLREREALLATQKAEVDALFDKRKETELAFMERKQKRQEQYQAEIEALLDRDREEHTKLKIKLEADIQTLEQQLQEMRATYQLNTEKLEYNYRVLSERDMENSATLSHQKRKLNKLKDALSGLMQRYQETDTRDRKRNEELTEEYRRTTKQYNDMQANFRHFEIADNNRYEQVWSMHREEVLEDVSKVLQADEVINRQQLGWEWKPPNMELLKELDVNSLAAMRSAAAGAGATGGVVGNTGSGVTTPGQSATSTPPGGSGPVPAGKDQTEEEDPQDSPQEPKISGTRMKAMLTLLAQEAGFLIDSGLREALEGMSADEAKVVSAVTMLKALGVEKESDMKELTRYFFSPEEDDPEDGETPTISRFRALGLDPAREPEALKVLLTIIRPDDVISAIHCFVKDRKEARLLDQTRTKSLSFDDDGAGAGIGDGASKTRRQREKVIRHREKDYWNTLGGVLGEDTFQVWEQLAQELERYDSLLAERSRRIRTVKSLQEENFTLKERLRSYVGSALNDNLIIPPTKTIQVDATGSARQRQLQGMLQ